MGEVLFFAVGLLGAVAHWAKAWSENRVGSFWKYMFVNNVTATTASVVSYVGAASALLAASPDLDVLSAHALAMSFMAGYTADSAVNRDK